MCVLDFVAILLISSFRCSGGLDHEVHVGLVGVIEGFVGALVHFVIEEVYSFDEAKELLRY